MEEFSNRLITCWVALAKPLPLSLAFGCSSQIKACTWRLAAGQGEKPSAWQPAWQLMTKGLGDRVPLQGGAGASKGLLGSEPAAAEQ